MCGRYVIARAAGDLLAGVELEESCADYNVAPTHTVPVIVDHAQEDGTRPAPSTRPAGACCPGGRRTRPSPPDLQRPQRDRRDQARLPPRRPAQHCAIPANGYYEWLRTEVPGRKTPEKTPYYVHPPPRSRASTSPASTTGGASPAAPMKDSGCSRRPSSPWTRPRRGGRYPDSETLRQLSRLHDRLPIPLETTGDPQDGLSTWLRTAAEGAEAAQRAIDAVRERAYDVAAAWRLREVGPAVGSPRNNGPELLEPAGQRRLL
ncbi:Uncharacterised ACR, COG2135 [Rothia kristinae]|nr:Uncharacterised ACR, COG2135 [Rothia kristinae]